MVENFKDHLNSVHAKKKGGLINLSDTDTASCVCVIAGGGVILKVFKAPIDEFRVYIIVRMRTKWQERNHNVRRNNKGLDRAVARYFSRGFILKQF